MELRCCTARLSHGRPHLTRVWLGRWTQVTDKQQSTLLLLQKEKGSLAAQLDSLREENDSLHAKNRSILANSMSAQTAEQDAEIAALRKNRANLSVELDALKAHSAVSQQQLTDKIEELRLSVHESRSLREHTQATRHR